MEKSDVILVIRPIHKANTMAYDYVAIEVPTETAEAQLNKPDPQRNAAWRGVRYATQDERIAFYGKEVIKQKPQPVENQTQEEELISSGTNESESKTVKKPKKSKE